MRKYRRSSAALVVAMGAALALTTSAPAMADDVAVEFGFIEPTLAVEYGQFWSFAVAGDYYFAGYLGPNPQSYIASCPGSYTLTSSGTPTGYTPEFATYVISGRTAGYLNQPYESSPLAAGSYTFTITGTGGDQFCNTLNAKTDPSAKLTVEKAKLGVELRVLADPSNGDAAIVTAKFTGRFVDEYSSSFFPGSALSPAGTWNITVKDADGEVATERSVERAAGDDVLATSFYWADAEPGEQYTASASFTPSGASANNFAIGAAQNFSYTAPQSARPVPSSSATEKPDASLPEPAGFGLPLWALILVIVLILGLGALVTVLSVRLSRRPSTSAGEVQP